MVGLTLTLVQTQARLFNRWSFGLAIAWLTLAGCRAASCEAPPEERTVTPTPDPPQPIEDLSLTLEGAKVRSLVEVTRGCVADTRARKASPW